MNKVKKIGRRGFIAFSSFLGLSFLSNHSSSNSSPKPNIFNQKVGEKLKIRRVVTGHYPDGRSRVDIDEINTKSQSSRSGHQRTTIWSTGIFPADNQIKEDGSKRTLATSDPNGTVFRIGKYDPGVAPRNHRTESIDYAVVLSGEIYMGLDDGEVHLRQGDVLVQRGTIHDWENRGDIPCIIAFILCAANPLVFDGKIVSAKG
tara:strand:- start:11911 stop:12519 length:609 start_codon:yes stop_codon:yes gene_type:complete